MNILKKDLYSINEIADLLGVTPITVRRYVKEGKINAVKVASRLIRIPFSEIEFLFPKKRKND